ncbi:MAG: hypothetical protein M3Z29_15765 [Pseudomonadota bacterium]|nr:hypothetical protein [Pseudomonadota bacterium]
MLRLLALPAALGLLVIAFDATAAPASAPHAAACVAALAAQESSLIETLKAGAAVEPELQKVVRSGITLIGTQYLAGLREAEARQLLKAAERDFQALPQASAEARQSECLNEGEALYARASALERSLISTAAERRIKRLRAA